MSPKRTVAVVALWFPLGAACGRAQIGMSQRSRPVSPRGPSGPTLQVESSLILVPALVLNKQGGIVPGLGADNFYLLDNGIAQHVTLEAHAERQPMDILVVLQTGGGAPHEFPYLRGMPTMLEALAGNAPHRFAVVSFDSQPEEQWDFTPELSEVADAFTAPAPGDREAAVLDALKYGIGELAKTPPTHRRILLLISQPQDDGSKTHAQEILRQLGENNIMVLALTFSPEKQWLKDQLAGDRVTNPLYQFAPGYPLLLHTFDLGTPVFKALHAMRRDTPAAVAELSGGEHLRFDDRGTLESQAGALVNHLPNRYLLSFLPHPPTPGPHTLELQVLGTEAAATIAARQSYWLPGTP